MRLEARVKRDKAEVYYIEPTDESTYRYDIFVELYVEFPGGGRIYHPGTRVFSPRTKGKTAYQACLEVWNKFIVPETSVNEHGRRFRYQILRDWGMGTGECSEFRYSDRLITFDLRFKMPVKCSVPGRRVWSRMI
jgi:hypothetical protein